MSEGLYLSHGNAAVHPQRDDLLEGHRGESAFQSDRRAQVDGPQQRYQKGFEELGDEQGEAQTHTVEQGVFGRVLNVVENFIDDNRLGGERERRDHLDVRRGMMDTARHGVRRLTGPTKAATMLSTPVMTEMISLVLWKRNITRTKEAFSRPD